MTAAHLKMWALILSGYSYDIPYRPGSERSHAVSLSRPPCDDPAERWEKELTDDIYNFTCVVELPVTSRQIRALTRKNPLLTKMYTYIITGWPEKMSDATLHPFFIRRPELSAKQGCILWGLRVFVQPNWQISLMDDLHEGHMGMTRMKGVARSYLWWPGLDQYIESCVRDGAVCMATDNTPSVTTLEPWSWPLRPWQHVHINYADMYGNNFLVLVDSHTKWLEMFQMHATTSQKMSNMLQNLLAVHGFPDEILLWQWTTIISLRPASARTPVDWTISSRHWSIPTTQQATGQQRGQSDCWNRLSGKTFSRQSTVVCACHSGIDLLISCCGTGILTMVWHDRTPAELFLIRQMRTRFSLLKPDLSKHVEAQQNK